MTKVEFHKIANMKRLQKPTMIVGFPGTGLVGSVAVAHLVDILKLDFGGYITSDEFAPLAAIHNYTPMPAARIHYSEKYNLVVILSEMSIPISTSNELANGIYSFARSLNARQIISLGGISLKEKEGEVYVISSSKELTKELADRKIAKPIKEGATTGVTGLLLFMGSVFNFPVITILVESSEEYLDSKAASRALKTLSKLIGVEINTAELDKEAKALKESIIHSKISKKGPSVTESGSMYG
ncbi:MAG: PAC2 family protein [Candidatus Bilamarchaeaceae archaeon]